MPIIRIASRPTTKEQRTILAKEIHEKIVEILKVPDEAVTIVFEDLPLDKFAVGGKLASEWLK